MIFDGSEYIVVVDYYSKMKIIRKILASQCNAAKTLLKELFAEHGIPESLHTDNGLEFANAILNNLIICPSCTITLKCSSINTSCTINPISCCYLVILAL